MKEQHAYLNPNAVVDQHAEAGQNAVLGHNTMQQTAPQQVQARPALQQAQAMPFHSVNAAAPSMTTDRDGLLYRLQGMKKYTDFAVRAGIVYRINAPSGISFA